jgi:hypothetical protein
VLVHNDVGTWNVVTDGRDGFGVIDWESATAHGLPLWDLSYFLADALTLLDTGRFADRTAALLRLFRGRSRWSGLLFENLRRAVRELAIAPEAVGPLVTLGWLHHGLSPARRRARLDTLADGADPADGTGPIPPLAGPWLGDPELGAGWRRWR